MSRTGHDDAHFDNDWLALREPVDHRSRAAGLARGAATFLHDRHTSRRTVVDMGTGSGSNVRYLAPFFRENIDWQLLDHDAGLLSVARAGCSSVVDADAQPLSLGTQVFDLAEPLAPVISGASLITASALLDLVSHTWLRSLIRVCADERAGVLMALSVNGDIRFAGAPHDDDALALGLLARHQRREKGLGAALGTAAPQCLIAELGRAGYGITAMPSIWHLGMADGRLARALIAGWAHAASDQAPEHAERLAAWSHRRTVDVAAGQALLQVGHMDVLGLPGPQR